MKLRGLDVLIPCDGMFTVSPSARYLQAKAHQDDAKNANGAVASIENIQAEKLSYPKAEQDNADNAKGVRQTFHEQRFLVHVSLPLSGYYVA